MSACPYRAPRRVEQRDGRRAGTAGRGLEPNGQFASSPRPATSTHPAERASRRGSVAAQLWPELMTKRSNAPPTPAANFGVSPDSVGRITPSGGTASTSQSNCGGCSHALTRRKSTVAPVNLALPKSAVPSVNSAKRKPTVAPENFAKPKSTVPPENLALRKPTLPRKNSASGKLTVPRQNSALPKPTPAPVNLELPNSTVEPENPA